MGKTGSTLETPEQILDLSIPWFDRLDLVKNTTNIELLGEALRTSPEAEIRTAIVHQIDDQELLEGVCYRDDDASVRRHAVSKLTDENADVLIHLIKNDPDHTVRREAVIRLHPGYQQVLHRVMIDDTHTEVRRKAIKKLRLERLRDDELSELCISGQEPLVRKGALHQLDNDIELKKVALMGEDYKIIELAIDKIDNEDYLKEIAKNAEFAHGRYSAIYKLDDQVFITDICLSDPNIEVKKSCIEKIDNLELLAKLRLEGNTDIQPLVRKKIQDIE